MDSVHLHGTGVVPGIAYAPAAWTRPAPAPARAGQPIPEPDRTAERDRFTSAADAVAGRFDERAARQSGEAAQVLGATAALARDRGWRRAAQREITEGTPAEIAVDSAIEGFVTKFLALGGLMAERATDLRDIRNRVVAELLGLPEPGVPTPSAPVVLCADDLAPADTATLDPSLITALVTRFGGPTSHTAIISRQLGIPCVVAAGGLDAVAEGTALLIDGATGTITVDPDPAWARQLAEKDQVRRDEIRAWQGPAHTADGQAVQVLANVQDGAAARKAATSEAEGVGLFRTELCFLTAQSEPSLEDQARIYGEVFDAFAGRKVVVRTLDAGSDKPVPFVSQDDEENPALGVRGLRLGWISSGLIERQLDAIKLAAERSRVSEAWVMAPMVATVDEAAEFAAACRERGLKPGVMVEVPSVALLADQFLAEVDFFSIGTNDLTQYTLAADRMASALAHLTDPWQPAVLRLIRLAADAGARSGKPVGVCGEAAADPLLAAVLVGLGVTSLSMAAGAIPSVGAQLGHVTVQRCREMAEAALAARTAADAKERARAMLD